MTKAKANENAKAMKAAAKKITPVPKHVPRETDDHDYDPAQDPRKSTGTAPFGKSPYIKSLQRSEAPAEGGCATDKPVVESGFSIFNQGTPTMTAPTQTQGTVHSSDKPATLPSPSQLEKEAAAKAKQEAAAKKKAEADTKRAADKEAREKQAKERTETAAANKAAREKRAQELKEAGRTYTGSMIQLADRVKQGAYVKSMTGQLRSTDELAVALDAVPPGNVVVLGLKALGLESNPYITLNIGQQSMNLRNRMRGAIKKGTLKLADVIAIRDTDGLATAEKDIAAKKEATAARLKKIADDKAAKEAAAQKAKDEAAAKKAAIDKIGEASGTIKPAEAASAKKVAAKKAAAAA